MRAATFLAELDFEHTTGQTAFYANVGYFHRQRISRLNIRR